MRNVLDTDDSGRGIGEGWSEISGSVNSNALIRNVRKLDKSCPEMRVNLKIPSHDNFPIKM